MIIYYYISKNAMKFNWQKTKWTLTIEKLRIIHPPQNSFVMLSLPTSSCSTGGHHGHHFYWESSWPSLLLGVIMAITSTGGRHGHHFYWGLSWPSLLLWGHYGHHFYKHFISRKCCALFSLESLL